MSGIAGIYVPDGRPGVRQAVARMLVGLEHRGPDGAAVWADGPVGLGHCMLRTTPEALIERLPVYDAATELAITADARLDNRDELTAALDLSGYPRVEITDSELILRAYATWGEDCVERLLGAFSFAIWDGRRRSLFCARDHFGVKPFCYYSGHGSFVFASEVKALIGLPFLPRRVNEARIADYLIEDLEGIDQTSTFYDEIYRLPPAHTLTVSPLGTTRRRYWSVVPCERTIEYPSSAEYDEAFLEIFTEAVRCRMRSASPVGSMLSGGMDSSSIVGVARRCLQEAGGQPLGTFSAVSRGASCPETASIRAVLAQGGLVPSTVAPDELPSFRDDLRRVIHGADDLFDNTISHVPLPMYAAAGRQGIRVLLDGLDGDLVLSHSALYLAYMLREGRWMEGFREASGIADFYHKADQSPWTVLATHGLRPLVPSGWTRPLRWLRRLRETQAVIQASIVSPAFARRIQLRERLAVLQGRRSSGLPPTLQILDVSRFSSANIVAALERYDRVAASCSVEPRHPFLDKRLVEFAMRLPIRQRMQRGWTKVILRRSMEGILPDSVCWRKGWEHLGPEFARAWAHHERDLVEAAFADGLKDLDEYLDTDRLRTRLESYRSGDSTIDDDRAVWTAMTLALWIQRQSAPLPAETRVRSNYQD